MEQYMRETAEVTEEKPQVSFEIREVLSVLKALEAQADEEDDSDVH